MHLVQVQELICSVASSSAATGAFAPKLNLQQFIALMRLWNELEMLYVRANGARLSIAARVS